MTEHWKPIPNNDRYDVSSIGAIYDNEKCEFKLPRIANGYLTVFFGHKLNGCRYSRIDVHRLVVWAFTGSLSRRSRHVNHKDGDKLNNNIDNLELVSPAENARHAVLIGLNKGKKKLQERLRLKLRYELYDIDLVTYVFNKRVNVYRHKTCGVWNDFVSVSRNEVALPAFFDSIESALIAISLPCNKSVSNGKQ